MKRTTTVVAALAALALGTGCELASGQPADIWTTEIEAPWIDVVEPTRLNVVMIPEGDFVARCIGNFGGTPSSNWRGQVCLDITNP